MVRLLHVNPAGFIRVTSRFNPTMVRLLLGSVVLFGSKGSSFNPTMVRLLLYWFNFQHRCQYLFQSHNGAIAALNELNEARRKLGFNPTMVRLLRGNQQGL